MNRNSTDFFAEEATIDIPRSRFTRNWNHKTSFNTGQLIPFYADSDIVPGMTIKNRTAVLCRMSTPTFPIMDNLYLDLYYFRVNHWNILPNWKALNGENETGAWAQTQEFEVPVYSTTTGNTVQIGDIANYMGVPPGIAGISFQQTLFRAYFRIYNYWFRDQNLIAPIQYDTEDTTVTYSSMAGGTKPLMAAKFHDYYTSSLPEPQKAEAVTLPLGQSAPVIGNNTAIGFTDGTLNASAIQTLVSGVNAVTMKTNLYGSTVGAAGASGDNMSTNKSIGLTTNPANSGLIADLSNVIGASINATRLAFATQRVFEKDARFGSNYQNVIQGQFGVTVPGASLHIPEYLGGKRIPINIETVLQNSSSDSTSPLGQTGAFSVTFDMNDDFTKSFDQHCSIIGIAVVRAQHTYQQGLSRMFTRKKRFDYYMPSFAHLGNQPIYNYEIYAQGNAQDNQVFGYKEAWAEYKYRPNIISGELMSQANGSLDAWHFADYYTSLPTLGQDWIQENPDYVDRTLAVSSSVSNQFIADFEIEQEIAWPGPLHSIPGLLDHY